jgi:hypothetical protein
MRCGPVLDAEETIGEDHPQPVRDTRVAARFHRSRMGMSEYSFRITNLG